MNEEYFYEDLQRERAINDFIDNIYIQVREFEQSLIDANIYDADVLDMLDEMQDSIENTKYTKMKNLKEMKDKFNNTGRNEIGFKSTNDNYDLDELDYSNKTPEQIEKDLHLNKYNSVAKINDKYFRLGDIEIVEFKNNIEKVNKP